VPKITAITQQQKHTERFSIFVDGKFLLGVDGSLVIKYDLKTGTEFDAALQHDLENDERLEQAYHGLLNFIAFRERCEHEVHEWLYRRDLLDLEAELLHRLKDRNYLNDARFTRLFIKDRVKLKGWGPIRLRHELNAKRIAKVIIEDELELARSTFNFDALAQQFVERKLSSLPHPTQKDKKRLWSWLQRRGFEGAAIQAALDQHTFIFETKFKSE